MFCNFICMGDEMTNWEMANEIESISHRLESVKSIIDIIAERIVINEESSALYGCSDMLDVYVKRLEKLCDDVMELHKEEKEEVTFAIYEPKKGKKK
jgi:hypothetical protein